MPTKEILLRYFKHKKTRQVVTLYSSILISVVLSVAISVINTRLLGPELFGDLKFLQRLFDFTVIFLTFGFFVSGSRLLAQKKYDHLRAQMTGTLLVCTAGISILLAAVLFIFSFFQNDLFNNQLGYYIRLFSPLLFVLPLQMCLEKVLLGDNRITEMSIKKVLVPAIYAVGAITFNYFVPLSLAAAMAIHFLSMAAVFLGIVVWIKPEFKNLKNNFALLLKENRTYGFPVYIGLITGVASGNLGEIFIGYFMENMYVGFFALAVTLTRPLGMIPGVVGTTFFKDFANRASIPLKVNVTTFVLTGCALLFYFVFIKYVFFFLYSADYAPALTLAYYLAVSTAMHGLGDYFTRFLGAHGRGKEMRNRAIVVGIINFAGAYFLVKYFGVMGAVTTKLIASSAYMLLCYAIYRRLICKLKKEKNQ